MQATTIVLHGMIILQASWKQSDSTSCVRKLQLTLCILYSIKPCFCKSFCYPYSLYLIPYNPIFTPYPKSHAKNILYKFVKLFFFNPISVGPEVSPMQAEQFERLGAVSSLGCEIWGYPGPQVWWEKDGAGYMNFVLHNHNHWSWENCGIFHFLHSAQQILKNT